MNINEDQVQALHEDAVVFLSFVSCHCEYLPDGRVDNEQFFSDGPRIQGSFPKLKRGGVDALVMSFGIGNRDLYPGKAAAGRVFQSVGNFHHVAARRSDGVDSVRTLIVDGATTRL